MSVGAKQSSTTDRARSATRTRYRRRETQCRHAIESTDDGHAYRVTELAPGELG
jgi:hypothetical protein